MAKTTRVGKDPASSATWTSWIQVDSYDDSPSGSGLYQLARRDGPDHGVPIARLLEHDDEGLLYMGAAVGDLGGRLGNLVASVCNGLEGPHPHHVGARFYGIRKLFVTIPRNRLFVRHIQIDESPISDVVGQIIQAHRSGKPVTDVNDVVASLGLPDVSDAESRFDETVVFLAERSGLREYLQKFGELPPLNYSRGRHTN